MSRGSTSKEWGKLNCFNLNNKVDNGKEMGNLYALVERRHEGGIRWLLNFKLENGVVKFIFQFQNIRYTKQSIGSTRILGKYGITKSHIVNFTENLYKETWALNVCVRWQKP